MYSPQLEGKGMNAQNGELPYSRSIKLVIFGKQKINQMDHLQFAQLVLMAQKYDL
jgi:hypothetical protein